ncbi:patatin-like phospholipase family protein [Ottowia sp. GY511]|uniref:Patatin-like phospholipase family protein n=1 Tax=Ottowia flava TaxID=2675430 RepID=A0ABW4KXF7_9BURK|nr:patatin-like phospholipase family protein [Ottowia sp. GY511]TXK31234.1 patatin-like phospholipase family protein [Ottowia sp. GY511]
MPEASEAATPDAARVVNLALQGGGSHGAFTWGVLDALLEDGRIDFEGASGASAGAMNAAVLAHGLARAQADGLRGHDKKEAARLALSRFWGGVGLMGGFMAGVPLPAAQAIGNWFSQWLSPYQTNPLGLNPLRNLLEREIDFELLARQRQLKVFVAATNVRTGRGEVFSGKRLSCSALMASACLPTLFQAVEIDGEYYWDGGYSGNPAIYPLIYETASADVILVQINPIETPFKPGVSAGEIMERVNEITFNAPLLAEMRAIEFVSRLLAEGKLDDDRYKDVRLHRVDGGAALAEFGATSKARADTSFLRRLFDLGRTAGQDWLAQHFKDLGVRASVEKVGHTQGKPKPVAEP